MKYLPQVKSANRIGNLALGPKHTVAMFDRIEAAAGSVQYAFLLAVFDNETQEPVLFVASEVNDMAAALGLGSHYLGLFDGEGHWNHGDSDAWGDPRKFFPEALKIAAARLGVAPEGAA